MEQFQPLYLIEDSSLLNQHVGELLNIYQSFEESTAYEGDVASTVSQTESLLEEATELEEDRRLGISELIEEIKKIDVPPPHDPDDDPDGVRPKYLA
ncbi:MAG: hypothetical protein AAFQ87_21510 [Bacteroidota bacterium]